MKVLLQRVSRARVRVNGETVGSIGRGLLALVAAEHGDDQERAAAAARKVAGLRIFEDDDGKMNLNVQQVGGGVLVVSQFTLLASTRKGRRPSLDAAAKPEMAEPLVNLFVEELERAALPVACGRFGAHMEVELVNDGPVTLWVET